MTKVLHPDHIDWSRFALSLGVELPPTEEAKWLELSREDLKMLHLLLTRQMPQESGGRVTYVQAPSAASEALAALTRALESMMKWQDAQLK